MRYRTRPIVVDAFRAETEYMIFGIGGATYVDIGDWIVNGDDGEHYALKPDEFEKRFEPLIELVKGDRNNAHQEPTI